MLNIPKKNTTTTTIQPSQTALGQHNDNFVCCPADALTWESRKYLILQEIIQNDPDVICLQVQPITENTRNLTLFFQFNRFCFFLLLIFNLYS